MQLLLAALYAQSPAYAFCGAYVAEDGASLSNRASRIVVARDEYGTTLSMFNDVQGDFSSFALLVPVPEGFDAGNLRLADRELLEKVDAYSAPRRVAYTCDDFYDTEQRAAISTVASAKEAAEQAQTEADSGDFGWEDSGGGSTSSSASGCGGGGGGSWSSSGSSGAWWEDEDGDDSGMPQDDEPAWTDTATGTEVEEEFDLGEYTAYVLDPAGGEGLVEWLNANGFSADEATADALQEQVDAGSHFLALRVDLDRAPDETTWLSPLQLGYAADNVTLPIRLGAASSEGVQDLVVFVVSSDYDGAWGISNYPEAEAPSSECLLELEGESFADWYEEAFTEAVGIASDPLALEGTEGLGWITEYTWGQGKCDPCTEVGPLETQEVRDLGLSEYSAWSYRLTRLRLRYTPQGATQDLALYPTMVWDNDQIRYVEHSWELESLLPTCGSEQPEEPGACYTAEWWARQAEQDLSDASTTVYEKGCLENPEPAGRALLLIPGLALLLWRRRR